MPDDKYLPDAQVCQRYHVSDTTLVRWERDPTLDFPKPIRVRGRKYRRLSELEAFEARQREDPQVTAWEPRDERVPARLVRARALRFALTRKAGIGPAELLHAIAFHSILEAVSSCAQRGAKIAMGEC